MINWLVTLITAAVVVVISLWTLWPRLRSAIEQPKHTVLEQIARNDTGQWNDASPPRENGGAT